jgi:hypothetical protein
VDQSKKVQSRRSTPKHEASCSNLGCQIVAPSAALHLLSARTELVQGRTRPRSTASPVLVRPLHLLAHDTY